MDQSKALKVKATLSLSGVVQGVGFRPFVARLARENRIDGFVRNESGQVYIEAVGYEKDVAGFIDGIWKHPPAGCRISRLDKNIDRPWKADECLRGFTIQKSGDSYCGISMPSPDIALCEDCLEELYTPGNPRYGNPFISCTNCGPRFSILRQLPYDRCSTTMDSFPLCSLCTSEYEDIADRRCHAQTVCCNQCGPSLSFICRNTSAVTGQVALNAVIDALKKFKIVAVKGIGGYHLACSPFDGETVATLRALKGRENKPFAVMFSNLEEIRMHCEINESEENLLRSPERPIVLLTRKESAISEKVYTSSRFLGVFLPYTPLQHLILRRTGPLVMTSANLTAMPIIKDDDEMQGFFSGHDELSGILLHNREILRRLDDSVAAVTDGKTHLLRRARGYVPLPLPISIEDGRSVLACGSQQKNTICLSQGEFFYPSSEIGDVDSLESLKVFNDTISDMQAMLGITPKLVVCDAHPDYESTRYALSTGLPVIKVQHHFAHIASVMAEAGLTGRVIGVAFDGTGYGVDGTVWGGEFLIASPQDFVRAGHLKSVKLLGSDESVRQGWKSAACMLYDAGILPQSNDSRYTLINAALDNEINTIRSSSMGRLFDAASSILDICQKSTYEGQCAIELENAAARFFSPGNPQDPFPFSLTEDDSGIIADMSPCIKNLYECKAKGMDRNLLALRFHMTVCRLIVDVCLRLREKYKIDTVALSGGVFQNRILLFQAVHSLEKSGFQVHTNRLVPSGDGGISLGQAYIGRMGRLKKEELQSCVLPFREN